MGAAPVVVGALPVFPHTVVAFRARGRRVATLDEEDPFRGPRPGRSPGRRRLNTDVTSERPRRSGVAVAHGGPAMDMMGFDLFLPPPWPDPDAEEREPGGGGAVGGDEPAGQGQPAGSHALELTRSPRPGSTLSPRPARGVPPGQGRNGAPVPGGARSTGGARSGTAGDTRSGATGGSRSGARGPLSPVTGGARAGGAQAARHPLPVLSPGPGRLELQAAAESYVDHNMERVRKVLSAWLREP